MTGNLHTKTENRIAYKLRRRFVGGIHALPLLVLSVLLFTSAVYAQDIQITATVDQTKVELGDYIAYTVQVSGPSQNLPYSQLPSFDHFTVVRPPSQSTQIIQVQNKVTVNVLYTVVLQPKEIGTFTIAPAAIEYRGQRLESNPITIEVAKEVVTSLPESLSSENIISARTDIPELNKQLKGKLFLRPVVSNATPYVGEQIVVSYYLYNNRLALANLGFADQQTTYKDFLKEDLYTANSLNYRDKSIDNVLFKVALLKKIALIPTKAGTFTLDPITLTGALQVEQPSGQRRSSRDFFGDPFSRDLFSDSLFDNFFGRNMVSVTIPSSPIEITVRPLPEPQPEGFSGTVGRYSLEANVDRTTASQDDLITLHLKFDGTGYVEAIAEPKLPPLEGFQLYESKASAKPRVVNDNLAGEKTFEYVLRPIKTGTQTISPVRYTIFDPETGQYRTLATKEIALNITPGKTPAMPVVVGQGEQTKPEEVVQLAREINYIKTSGFTGGTEYTLLVEETPFLLLQVIPLSALALGFWIKRRREMMERDLSRARSVRARGIAARRLNTAAKFLRQQNHDQFFAELANALRGYFSDKLNRQAVGLTNDEIVGALEGRGISPEMLQQIAALLDQCDTARYAGTTQHAADDMRAAFQTSTRLINQIEKVFRKVS
jgi:hypothetical protein